MVRAGALLVLLALVPLAAAVNGPGNEPVLREDHDARDVSVLAYHPYPDPEGDPWGFPTTTRNGTAVGYMEGAYAVVQYPTAVFDGLEKVEGSTGFLQTHELYEAKIKDRLRHDAPVTMSVGGVRQGLFAAVEVDLWTKRAIDSDNLTLRIVLFEDEVPFDGGNGVPIHRFVVRSVLHDALVDFLENGTAQIHAMARFNASWNLERVGVVASLHNRDATSRDAATNEVLQAATYLFRQDQPTRQTSKGVLLEFLTATWCAACLYGDGAVDDLANAYGVPSSRVVDRDWAYWRGTNVGPLTLSLLVGGIVAVVALLRGARRP